MLLGAVTAQLPNVRDLILDQLLTGDAPLHLGHFALDGTGLVVTGSPPYEEWERCGAVLHQIDGAVQWWLGDWLNYGEHAYGEKYGYIRVSQMA